MNDPFSNKIKDKIINELNQDLYRSLNLSLYEADHYFGYSDHTHGIATCLLAISRGAKIIEKHFTLDKSNTTIRDHALSATPDEFKNMVNLGREIYKKVSLGI